ncbi:MAG TPA: thiamine pyrophosphate-dependent enzyme [Thermoplasmata archaeon]|nr:thiamine pyrophosphate-dependent enzyme [Thermoplasmata archaeon]
MTIRVILPPFLPLEEIERRVSAILPGIDIESIAHGYGVPSRTVPRADELDEALAEARDRPGPAFVNVEMHRTLPELFS